MRVKLTLKAPYRWGNTSEFVQTEVNLKVGDKISFYELNPRSEIGDLRPDSYHYFNKTYLAVSTTELIEQ